jgi:hypothetical protein
MIKYFCDKCGKECQELEIKILNGGKPFCDKCQKCYLEKLNSIEEKYEKSLDNLKKEFKIN